MNVKSVEISNKLDKNLSRLHISPNFDKKISRCCNRLLLSGVIYHEAEQSHYIHFTSGVKVNNTWFLISGKRISKQQKMQCSSIEISVPYILIHRKKINFLRAQLNSLKVLQELTLLLN